MCSRTQHIYWLASSVLVHFNDHKIFYLMFSMFGKFHTSACDLYTPGPCDEQCGGGNQHVITRMCNSSAGESYPCRMSSVSCNTAPCDGEYIETHMSGNTSPCDGEYIETHMSGNTAPCDGEYTKTHISGNKAWGCRDTTPVLKNTCRRTQLNNYTWDCCLDGIFQFVFKNPIKCCYFKIQNSFLKPII